MTTVKDSEIRFSECTAATEGAARCLICGSAGTYLYKSIHDRLLDTPGTWSFLECPSCGLLWLNPRPAKDRIDELYGIAYCTHTLNEQKPYKVSLRTRLENAVLAGSFGYCALLEKNGLKQPGYVLGLFPLLRDLVGAEIMWLNSLQKGRLLDIGCGNGRFLFKMRSLGWDVIGVEPDSIAAGIAREHFKLNVISSGIEEADLPLSSFQAITLRHVIEHVHDPIGLLRKCYRLLAPGGRLVVLTPNARSLGHRFFRANWSELDSPRHLYLFSPKALREVSTRAGFPSSSQVRGTARAARWTWAPSASIRSTGKPGAKAGITNIMRFAFWSVEELLNVFPGSPYGEELLLLAQKE